MTLCWQRVGSFVADNRLRAADIGYDRAGFEGSRNFTNERQNVLYGCADDDEICLLSSFSSGLEDVVAPIAFRTGMSNSGASGPNNDAFSQAIFVTSHPEGASEKSWCENGESIYHGYSCVRIGPFGFDAGEAVHGSVGSIPSAPLLTSRFAETVSFFKKYGNRSNERRKAKQEAFVIGLLLVVGLLFIFGMWWLSSRGPSGVSAPSQDEAEALELERKYMEQLAADVVKLEEQFAAVIADGDVSETDLELLQLALSKQREISATGVYGDSTELDKLAAMEARYQTYAGATLLKASEASEAEAEAAVAQGRTEDALESLRKAIELQEEINTLYARGEHRSVVRIRQLQMQRENLEAEPLASRALELAQEAKLLISEGDADAAIPLLLEASELQSTLQRDFRASRFSNRTAQREIATLLIDAQASGLATRRDALKAESEALMKSGDYVDAAERLEEARDVQRELTARFPESSEAGADLLEALESERQSVLSASTADSIRTVRSELINRLRARESRDASPLAAEYFRGVEQLHANFSASRHLNPGWLLESRYLNLKRDDLGTIQDAVYDRLVALPGSPDKKMLSTEVSQILFQLVMGTNPSSQAGNQLPVDSIDYGATQEFCERLSWIMGFKVELPTREDYQAALGEVDRALVMRTAWASQNAERRTHTAGSREANTHGYFDLLGNVSEWTLDRRSNDERQILVWGGSVRDTVESLTRVPAVFVSSNERSRFTGFRVIVDFAATPIAE